MPTKIKEVPSKDFLENLFYEKEGFIYWREKKISRGRDSERAHRRVNTYKTKGGYWKVVIKGQEYMLSRIVYQMHFGDLTTQEEVDHIDRNIDNNCIFNLRKVSQEVNKRNKKRPVNSPEGQVVGVQLCRKKHPAPYENKISLYYVARWYDDNGKLKGKAFSIDKLGEDTAYQLAKEYREDRIKERNERGAGYSETHGLY